MRNLFLLFLLITTLNTQAQQTDTSAYQTQRLKVNALLNQRSARFGQYDESLTAKTGIFGIQTKSDVKKSNEILRQIVVNDNTIFKELKILMDYKDLEVKHAKDRETEVNLKMQNYMDTIKKLQKENEGFTLSPGGKGGNGATNYIIAILVIMLISMYAYYQNRLKQRK